MLMIHVVILVVLSTSNFIDRVQYKLGLETNGPELTKHYNEMLAYHKRMDGNIPPGAIIFIGDSLTQSLAVTAITSFGVNFGIGRDTSIGVIHRINQYTSIKDSKIVVIAIGLNDLTRREPCDIIQNYNKIIDSLPKCVQVIFSGVHPVDEGVRLVQGRNNNRINKLNTGLKELCARVKNAHFVNVTNVLSDETGNLSNKYHVGDGVHLNTKGYSHWIRELRRAIESLSKDTNTGKR